MLRALQPTNQTSIETNRVDEGCEQFYFFVKSHARAERERRRASEGGEGRALPLAWPFSRSWIACSRAKLSQSLTTCAPSFPFVGILTFLHSSS